MCKVDKTTTENWRKLSINNICKVTFETTAFMLSLPLQFINIQQFFYYKYCRAYCSVDHYLIGKVFQGSLYTGPTRLLGTWTTYDEPLLCKNHENIKKTYL
jgi:hypothetical protein